MPSFALQCQKLHSIAVGANQLLPFGVYHYVHAFKGDGAHKHSFCSGDNYSFTGCAAVLPAYFNRMGNFARYTPAVSEKGAPLPVRVKPKFC